MTNVCPVCCKRILNHAFQLKCCACNVVTHMKCITFTPEDQQSLFQNQLEWLCKSCLLYIFPFDNIIDDKDFVAAVNCIDKAATVNDSDLIFHPFKINDTDHASPLCEIDPDVHFYNSIDTYLSKCNFFDEYGFAQIVSNMAKPNGTLSFCHLNIRSIKQTLSNFVTYLKCLSFGFSIIGLTETWMRDDICDLHSIEGYELFEKHRSNKSGSGVGLFVAEKMEFVKRNDLCYFDDCIECVSIEIDRLVFSTKRNVVVPVIYRPPNTGTRHFNEKLCALLECISSEKKLCYLIGDYNINILNYGNHSATDEFVYMLYSHAFLPLINRPTRITQTSATILDNIFTNNIDERECGQNGILVTDISDHFPIFYIGHNTQVIESDETYITSRNYSNVNKLSFQQALSEIDWSEIYMISDAQPAFTWFYSRCTKLFDKHFPKKKNQISV